MRTIRTSLAVLALVVVGGVAIPASANAASTSSSTSYTAVYGWGNKAPSAVYGWGH